jgi:hypothetical protein
MMGRTCCSPDTNSPRKVLKSSPWASEFCPLSTFTRLSFSRLALERGEWRKGYLHPMNRLTTLSVIRSSYTRRIGPGYFASSRSLVTSVIPSTIPCASKMRSKGSLCVCGNWSG